MTRNENQMYSDVSSIAKSLEKIANALEKKQPNIEDLEYLKAVKCSEFSSERKAKLTKDIPGFEGTLDALDALTDIKTITDEYASNKEDDSIHNDYLNEIVTNMNQIEYSNFHRDLSCSFAQNDATEMTNFIYELEYEECLGAIKTALFIKGDSDYIESVHTSNLGLGYNEETIDKLAKDYIEDVLDGFANQKASNNDPYTYDNDLNEYVDGIKNDSDHDIRSTAKMYFELLESTDLGNPDAYKFRTKKDCILDYVTNEFGLHGARYTDIIKFAYYLGAPNALKYTSADRGYYSCAFATRFGGHLIQGGKDFLVKGINNDGKERYFAHSNVDSFTDYYKRIS
jgi:hypothetical protein